MTLRAAVIGDPISHSLSPRLHGYWLDSFGIDGVYEAVRVSATDLGDFMARVRAGDYRGVNVTVPHKESVLAHCDSVSETARIIGAVNTVWLDDAGGLYGDNSDVTGFAETLSASDVGDVAIILGAGGASRAVIYALSGMGFREIRVINRTLARARALACEFSVYGDSLLSAIPLSAVNDYMADCDLLVNCTSAEVCGADFLFPDFSLLRRGCIVYDISYRPYETEFLRIAGGYDLDLRHGLDMLIRQAVLGFCRWYGAPCAPDVTDERLRDYLLENL